MCPYYYRFDKLSPEGKKYYRSHIPISPGGPRVCPINANRAHAEGRNECTESLPGASQGGLPGQVNGGMDAWDLKGVHHVQNWIIFRASGCWFVVAMLQHKHSTKQWWKELRGGRSRFLLSEFVGPLNNNNKKNFSRKNLIRFLLLQYYQYYKKYHCKNDPNQREWRSIIIILHFLLLFFLCCW